jgi:CheY-like chemotaxis protein
MPKILIADDSIAVRKVAERLLTGAGLDVALASSGEEAMAWLAQERPDLVISDVIMPDKSGYDVCTFVRSHAVLSDTPVILISGIVNAEVTRQAESCRADGVLKKPFQGSSLQDRVRELLAKRQAPVLEPTVAPPVAEEPMIAPPQMVPPPFVAVPTFEPPPSPPPSAPKIYRITEEQLQTFRQASARIKELEGLLVEEQAKSARHTAEAARQDDLESRVRELEERLGQAERRANELEAVLTEERARAARPAEPVQESAPAAGSSAETEALLAQEKARNSYLLRRLEVLEQVENRVKELEAALAQERAKPAAPAEPPPAFARTESRISELETQLAQEQQRAFQLLARMDEVERAAAQAHARLEEMTRRLLDIARLATLPADSGPGARNE